MRRLSPRDSTALNGCSRESRDGGQGRGRQASRRRALPLAARRAPSSGSSRAGVCTWLGRSRHTNTPTSETAASTHRAVCMLAMNGASFCADSPLARPENTANSVALGTAEVMIASTNAIDSTAPVFCSSVRAPAAMPRRWAGHDAHHRGGVGAVEHARADADQQQPQRALPVGGVDLERRHRRQADGAHEHPDRGQRARAVPVGVDAGDRRGDQHAQRERYQLDARVDRRVALGALVVEDEQEHQREARQAVDERGGAGGGEQAVAEDLQVEHRRRASGARSAPTAAAAPRRRARPAITIAVVPAAEPAARDAEHEAGEADHERASSRARHSRARSRVWRARAGSARPRRRRRARTGR